VKRWERPRHFRAGLEYGCKGWMILWWKVFFFFFCFFFLLIFFSHLEYLFSHRRITYKSLSFTPRSVLQLYLLFICLLYNTFLSELFWSSRRLSLLIGSRWPTFKFSSYVSIKELLSTLQLSKTLKPHRIGAQYIAHDRFFLIDVIVVDNYCKEILDPIASHCK